MQRQSRYLRQNWRTVPCTHFHAFSHCVWSLAWGLPPCIAGAANPVYFSTNGEYYQVIDTHVTWQTARDSAAAASYQGVPGRLATVNSQAENDFIVSIMTGVNDSYWVGGFQDHSAPDYSEPGGGWRWITNEPFTYTHWRPSPVEPSNFGGNEDFLEVIDSSQNGYWNDLASNSVLSGGYIIEYTPEPSSSLLLGIGVCAALLRRRWVARRTV